MTDDSAADAERLVELIHGLWLQTKPSHEAQGIRAALSTSVDDARFPTWALDQLPDHVWNLVDVAAQRALDSCDAAMREARAEIDLARDTSHSLYDRVMQQQTEIDAQRIEIAHLRAAPSARVIEAARKHNKHHTPDCTVEIQRGRKCYCGFTEIKETLAEHDAAPPDDAAPQRESGDG